MTTLTAATPSMGGAIMPGHSTRPGASAGAGITGADALRIMRQRLVSIIIVWLFLSGAAVAFSLYMKLYYPKYTAFALIRVESIHPPNVTDPLKRAAVTQEEIDRELQNQALHVVSPRVLQRALENPDLRKTYWYAEADEKVNEEDESYVDLLNDILVAAPIRDSNYLKVSAVWKNPDEVYKIVNTVVQQYIDEVDRQRKDAIRSADEQLAEEVNRAKQNFEQVKREIENFSNEFSMASSHEADEELLTLRALVTELQVEALGLRTQWENLRNAKPEDMPITPQLQAILSEDPIIDVLERRLLAADQDLDMALLRFGRNHRVVRAARENRDAAAERVNQERAAKTLRYKNRQIQRASSNYHEAQDQLMALQDKLFEAKAAQRDKDVKRQQYEALFDERDMARFQYETLLEKKSAIDMALRAKRTVQIELQSRAIKPTRISSPVLGVWIPVGCVLALAMSAGLAFLLELTDKSVRTPRDVLRTHIPVLGTIPTTDDDEVMIERVETASLDAPHSIVAEAFRNLRANLFFSAPAEQQGVLLVTSPSGGNGKTTVSTNLAISIALSGRRVLLIDSNFRRSGLPRIFPNMKTEGLSNILIGQGYLRDYVTQTSIPGLDVLSAGPTPPNPAELLGSSYLRDIVVDARSRYDLVIFDGPPVLLVSDAMVLAGAVDGCLLVCEYRATSRGALQRTQSSLEAINARIFGAVLNRVQTRAGGYFRKAYREFYEYHESEEGEEETQKPQLDVTSEEAVEGRLPSDRSDPPGGSGEAPSQDDALVETTSSVVLDAQTAEEAPEPLSDFNVEGLDIIDDHDLGGGSNMYDSSGADAAAWPESQQVDTGPAPADLDSEPLGSEPLSGEPIGDDLMDLESEDFKLDDHFDDWGGGLEGPDKPDESRD